MSAYKRAALAACNSRGFTCTCIWGLSKVAARSDVRGLLRWPHIHGRQAQQQRRCHDFGAEERRLEAVLSHREGPSSMGPLLAMYWLTGCTAMLAHNYNDIDPEEPGATKLPNGDAGQARNFQAFIGCLNLGNACEAS